MLRVLWKIPLCALFAKFAIFQGERKDDQPVLRVLRILLLGKKSENSGRSPLSGPLLSKRASLPVVTTVTAGGWRGSELPSNPPGEENASRFSAESARHPRRA